MRSDGNPNRRRILLADDDEVVQEVVKVVAERRGYSVLPASTGLAALSLAVSEAPDLIVLDMSFPDADGRDVLRKLKADRRTAHIPVVVWSGGRDGHDSDSKISLDLGAAEYVEKGDAELFVSKLERVLARRPRPSSAPP
jgi:CheY-like chemotaxis protein